MNTILKHESALVNEFVAFVLRISIFTHAIVAALFVPSSDCSWSFSIN